MATLPTTDRNYSIEDLKTEFGDKLANEYLVRVQAAANKRGKEYRFPVDIARQWLVKDGKKPIPQIPKQEKPDYEAYRQSLIEAMPEEHRQLREKVIEPLREEVGKYSWEAFINVLAIVSYDEDSITLFHEWDSWLEEHYKELIETRTSGKKVKFTKEVPVG